ncbi:isopentenyl-diphosphate delta isomerase [Vairimorpha necatrix]|uniref:isopentenyl-diphosphate Delta-isomerase n=1 Tax=Vairimorpha necatrix TaxID=6039 RepID=A0AAX4JCN4_9MICR
MDNYNKDLIVVDEHDNIVGTIKALTGHYKTHLSLHRAFSLFLVDDNNKLLIQQRSSSKLVFPNKWANSVCSHPFLNALSFSDPIQDAKNHLIKRMDYELGLTGIKEEELQFIGRLLYKATDTEYYGHLLDGEPKAQEYKEFPIVENIEMEKKSENFFEWEVDYIFVCKKQVGVKMNKEEVQDIKMVDRNEYEEMRKEKKITKWTELIVEKTKIFDILEKM